MRPPLPVALTGLAVLSLVLAGCIQGAFFPAEFPALAPGWVKDQENTEGGEKGVEPIVKARYQVNAYNDGDTFGGQAFLVSVSDVPLLDEQAEIKKQIDPLVAQSSIRLAERSRGTATVQGSAASYVVYDASRELGNVGSAKGLALDLQFACAGNGEAVRLFGFAMTEITSSSLLGSQTRRDTTTWIELAGGAEGGSLGGMASAIKCS